MIHYHPSHDGDYSQTKVLNGLHAVSEVRGGGERRKGGGEMGYRGGGGRERKGRRQAEKEREEGGGWKGKEEWMTLDIFVVIFGPIPQHRYGLNTAKK